MGSRYRLALSGPGSSTAGAYVRTWSPARGEQRAESREQSFPGQVFGRTDGHFFACFRQDEALCFRKHPVPVAPEQKKKWNKTGISAILFQYALCSVNLGTSLTMEQVSQKSPQDPPSESELLAMASDFIRSFLPQGWALARDLQPMSDAAPRRRDAVIRITSPDGRNGELPVEVKSILSPKDVSYLSDQPALWSAQSRELLFVARYLSPRTRKAIEDRSASYIDATGNARVSLDEPAFFLKTEGANSDPFRRRDRRTSSLKGRPAAHVVRALIDFYPPWKMRDLELASGTSLASISRSVEFLDREQLVTRNERGSIETVDWEELMLRWSEDYQLIGRKGSKVERLVAVRGLPRFVEEVQRLGSNYAISGSIAAQDLAPYADPEAVVVYVKDLLALKDETGVAEASSSANVIAIQPEDDLPFVRARLVGDTRVVAPSQACIDLLTGPGRNPSEGMELLRWLKENEEEWRRDGLQ